MIVGAYAAGLLVVDRLFRVVKSKLLSMKWFAALATTWVEARNRASVGIGLSMCSPNVVGPGPGNETEGLWVGPPPQRPIGDQDR